jgi:CubicO group peptidase (beta-lactamase class C family)|tara:strand:+ start:33955 stop:35202 length:1248 start_codon:yes stop_codon:yes gene_type:complete
MVKKGLKLLRKLAKGFFVFLLAIIILVNLFILLSGRTYLYKGIANTYLVGKTGPDIYDLNVFPYAALKKSNKTFKWKENEYFNQYSFADDEIKMHEKTKSTAFLVFKDNELLFEKYWEEHQVGTVSNSFSAAKTVVALLVGIAIEEGNIKSLDESVGNYIPAFQSDDKKDITIRDVLQMASGLDWVESGKNPLSTNAESYYGTDLYGLVCRQKGIDPPGKIFNYQSGNSQLLSFIVEKATGQKIWHYAQEKLWLKIGTQSDAFWSLDKDNGAAKAFCCLYATARDFGRLGKLILNNGNWEGKQIVPESFIEEMVSSRAPVTKDGLKNTCYAMHIWTYNDGEDDVFYCRGILGQYIAVIPAKNLVFVRLGHKRIPYLTFEEYKIDKKRGRSVQIKDIDHPKDFLAFLKTAKKIAKQ